MAAEIVHDHDVAGPEGRDQMLCDIGLKAFTVDGAIKDIRRRELIAPQRSQERHCAPSPMGCKAAQPLAFRPPASQRRHVGLDPGLIDEHQVVWIEAVLPALPPLAPPGNVATGALIGDEAFF